MKVSAASPRKRPRLGDVAFNAVLAGVAFALLLATVRHLFETPYADFEPASITIPRPVALATPPRAAVAPPVRGIAATAAPAPAPAAVRARSGRATSPGFLAASGVRSRTPEAVRIAPQPKSVAAARPRNVDRTVTRPRLALPAARTRSVQLRANPSTIARTKPVVRPVPSSATHGRTRPRRGRPTGRGRSIVEPPLGYDARPALVVAPAALPADFTNQILPTIRSRRHHFL